MHMPAVFCSIGGILSVLRGRVFIGDALAYDMMPGIVVVHLLGPRSSQYDVINLYKCRFKGNRQYVACNRRL
jgi:ABC-type Mn2+/Zn2+ transport system permease subunit